MKKLTVILTSLLLLLCCIPCNIFADEPTYTQLQEGCYILHETDTYIWYLAFDKPVRQVALPITDTVLNIFSVSDEQFHYKYGSVAKSNWTGCNYTPTDNPPRVTVNGTYYWAQNVSISNDWYYSMDYDVPLKYDANGLSGATSAVYWTYGAGAVDPEPPTDWGMLLDIGFSTSLATNGDRQLEYNIDHFYWNNRVDSHGNPFIDTCKVEIYASSIYYYGAGYIPLINSTMYNFTGTADYLAYKVLATAESASKTWGAVASGLSLSMGDLKPFAEGEDWYQYGWIYKIRLIEETSGYVGPWQILHTITSLPPSQTENVYNSTTINQSVINAIEIVNTINQEQNTVNNETNYHTENWTINETVINSGNQPEYPGIPELINYEDDFGADLTNDLQDLDLETPFSFLNGTGMQNALHWIRQVHLETIEQTELLTPLLVTMLVGLAVYLIGRRRG